MNIFKYYFNTVWYIEKRYLVLGIVAIIIIAGGTYLFNQSSKDNILCEELGDIDEKINCYKELLKEKKEISICNDLDSIEELYLQDVCYSNLALIEKNYSICKKYLSSKDKEECYINIVEAKEEAFYCEELPNRDLITYCYSTFAIHKKDASLCENLKNEKSNRPIYHPFSSGESGQLPSRVYGTEKDYCYLIFAKSILEKSGYNNCSNI